MKLDQNQEIDTSFDFNSYQMINRWILHELNKLCKEINHCFEHFEFGEATIKFQNFWLYQFCDVYLECIKPILNEENYKKET